MLPEKILAWPARVLSQVQREFYFEKGYLFLESIVETGWLPRLRAAMADLIERSRAITQSDTIWNLEPGHSAKAPRLRRVTSPADQHPSIWGFVRDSSLADIAADLVGPDVKFIESQLNFKWAGGGAAIKWHQDIQFSPYTNYSETTFGIFLDDVTPDRGPMGVIPLSHKGELFDLYNERDEWTGYLSDADLDRLDLGSAVYLTGPAGSIQVHNCRIVHGSAENHSNSNRPLLLIHYCSADSFPYSTLAIPSRYCGEIVRGKPARWAHLDPRPCLIPPDWTKNGGYQTVFAYQQGETRQKPVQGQS